MPLLPLYGGKGGELSPQRSILQSKHTIMFNRNDKVIIHAKTAGKSFSYNELVDRFGHELIGTVVGEGEEAGDLTIVVKNSLGKEYSFYPHDLELVANQKNNSDMIKLTDAQKAALTPDAQAMVEAGLLDVCSGNLTSKGWDVLNAMLIEENREQLVKKAKKMLSEAEAKETLAKAKTIIANS